MKSPSNHNILPLVVPFPLNNTSEEPRKALNLSSNPTVLVFVSSTLSTISTPLYSLRASLDHILPLGVMTTFQRTPPPLRSARHINIAALAGQARHLGPSHEPELDQHAPNRDMSHELPDGLDSLKTDTAAPVDIDAVQERHSAYIKDSPATREDSQSAVIDIPYPKLSPRGHEPLEHLNC